MNFTEQEIRDKRYDSVFHLVTAADGVIEINLFLKNKYLYLIFDNIYIFFFKI